MKQAPDRKRLRREYLKKKISAYLSGAGCGLILLPSLLVFVTLACTCLGLIWCSLRDRSPEYLCTAVCVGGLAAYAGIFLMGCWHGIAEARQNAAIAYVPPFTAETLPVNEILVRGSEEPSIAESEVLLRAAKAQETPPDELLRVSIER